MPDAASSPSHHPLGGTKPEPDCKESEDVMVLQSVPPSLLSTLDSSSMENLFDKAMEDVFGRAMEDSKPFGVAERSDSGTMMPDDFTLPPSSLAQAALYYNVAEVYFGQKKMVLKHKLVGRDTTYGRELVSMDEIGSIQYRHLIQKPSKGPCFPYTPHNILQKEKTHTKDRRLVVDFHYKNAERVRHYISFNGSHPIPEVPKYVFTHRPDFENFQSEVCGKLLKASFEVWSIYSDSFEVTGLALSQDLKIWEDVDSGHIISFYINREHESRHVEFPLAAFEKEAVSSDKWRAKIHFKAVHLIAPNLALNDGYISVAPSGRSSSSSYAPSSNSSYAPSSSSSYATSVSSYGTPMDAKFEETEMVTSFAKTYKFFRFHFSNSNERSRFVKAFNKLQNDEFSTGLYQLSTRLPTTTRLISVTEMEGEKDEEGQKKEKQEDEARKFDSELQDAISSYSVAKVEGLLQYHLPELAATEQYSWLTELTPLGYSVQDIADVLLEKGRNGLWIFGGVDIPKVVPFEENFHVNRCVHNITRARAMSISDKNHNSIQKSSTLAEPGLVDFQIREAVQHLCGLGGIRAIEGNLVDFGSVTFEPVTSTAIVCIEENRALQEMEKVLDNLERAAGILQQVGGCCDSFTVLCRQGSSIKMVKIELVVIRQLKELSELPANALDRLSSLWPSICPLVGFPELLKDIPGRLQHAGNDGHMILVLSLATQFLALAILSYAQAHCAPIRPFFLDTPQKRVVLMGADEDQFNLGFEQRWDGPYIVGSSMQLTCMGEMIGQPVFAFEYFPQGSNAVIWKEESHEKFDLLACAEDVLDTWGPGELITDVNDPNKLLAISIGGGFITAIKKAEQTIFHWSTESPSIEIQSIGFDRRSEVIIGALIAENSSCKADIQEQIGKAVALLEELGTFPSYWEVSERQLGLGLQGGQYLTGCFQINQTWVKMPGYTKKAAMLLQRAVYTSDLESHFGVQVSFCTGIARRVRLRELLADILPAYITALVAKPPLWKSLNEELHIIDALRGPNLARWLEELDHEHQKTFESLVMAVLLLLQGTGIDRKGQNFIIACAQPHLPFQCFKVPTTRESYWARMLADSEETATFAYITTTCLETDQVMCRGPGAAWANSTGLLWTTVSCYQDRSDMVGSSAPSTTWALKHSEAYLLGKPDAPLFVRVDRPNQKEEPRLLVSLSKIPPEYLYRLQMKAKPRRLREKKALDQFAEDVLVLVKQHGKP